MQFALNEQQALFKDTVDKFVQDRYSDNQRRAYRASASGYNLDNWRSLAELGLFALPFSAADGGMGATPSELITVMEALGGGQVAEPMLEEVVVAGGLLAGAGQPQQKAAWLPRIMAGEAHLTLAHFEHTARFNLSDVRLKVQLREGVAILEGEKSVVPLAAACDQWIVSARENGEVDDPAGIGFYLVSPATAGLERRDFRLTDGSVASCIRFRGVRAHGRLSGGYAEFAAAIDMARLAAGAEMLGIMSSLLNATVEYLRTRQQFGAPLSSFQVLQHRLADLYVLLEQSRSHLYRAAASIESGANAARSVAGMKSYVSRAAIEMGETCVHLHGAIGTTDELAIGHGYKRLLLLANLFGDADFELARFCGLAS